MILADLHAHTRYSHGSATPQEMYAAAVAKGLEVFGFTEHSPRPAGFDYRTEYRERLACHLSDYFREVRQLQTGNAPGHAADACRVLCGMEMDWLEGSQEHIDTVCRTWDLDYLLGSVHFLGHWGFDDGADSWNSLSQEECEANYQAYFLAWRQMIDSGRFQIAAHPDLIKIFSVEQFHIWLHKPGSLDLIRQGLRALRAQGMSMEISSAGLRKVCREIYPAPPIMALAAELEVPISFASDAHTTDDVGFGFARLESYAKAFGFREYCIFDRGRKIVHPI